MDIIFKTPQGALTPHLQHASNLVVLKRKIGPLMTAAVAKTHFNPHCRKLEISALNSSIGTHFLKNSSLGKRYFF